MSVCLLWYAGETTWRARFDGSRGTRKVWRLRSGLSGICHRCRRDQSWMCLHWYHHQR